MSIRLGSVVRSGVVVASAAATIVAAVVAPAPEVRPVSAPAPVCVDLMAVARPLVPEPGLSALAELSPAQVVDVGNAVTAVAPLLVTTPGLINLANFIDDAYVWIEQWVAYAFEWVAYAVSWIPYIGWIIDDQVSVVYNFVESLIHSGVFNVTDWMRGEGTFAKNLADWVVDLGLSVAWLAIDEVGAWIPLPPLNYPPRPPYADLPEGLFGDVIVDASAALARVSNGIWDVWEPIKGGIDNGVAWISGVLDRFARVPFVPLINFELNEAWTLIATEGDAITGFAHDLINAGNQFVVDTVDGGGLISATITAFNTTLASIRARGGQAVQAFVDWGRAQIDYLVDAVTPGSARVAPAESGVSGAQADVVIDEHREDATTPVAEPDSAVTHDTERTLAPRKVRTSRTVEVAASPDHGAGLEEESSVVDTEESLDVEREDDEPEKAEPKEDKPDTGMSEAVDKPSDTDLADRGSASSQ